MEIEEVAPTEAELTGEEVGKDPLFLGTPITPDATPVTPPTPPPTPAPEKEADPKPGDPPAPPTPPPAPPKDERTVPLAALHEERIARQRLAAELEVLRKQVPTEPRKTAAELILEDPENAMTVLTEEINTLRADIARRDMEREIDTAVPNFLEIAPQMEELMLGEGFNEESIRSMIGASGKDAPKFFKMLAKLTSQPNEEAMRTKIVAELTPTITTAVTKDLMAKFKIVEGDKSLDRLPGTPPDGKLNIGSEEEFAKLPPAEQEKWLSGEL
jgi:hypothetical protein